ncbi:MAG: XRE family transcriptional regulator, partial [Streptococcus sp.]
MTIKEDLGRRIKAERNRQQLTQSLLCGDETKLTIRQLQRIEGGQS